MSDQTTFPIIFYESKCRMFCVFAFGLFGALCLLTLLMGTPPIYFIAILGFLTFVPEWLHCLKFLFVSKPVLIIERKRIIVPDCVFWYKSIWYKEVSSFELAGATVRGVTDYCLQIKFKNGSYKEVPFYKRYCKNKLYEVSEIIQIIQTAHYDYNPYSAYYMLSKNKN